MTTPPPRFDDGCTFPPLQVWIMIASSRPHPWVCKILQDYASKRQFSEKCAREGAGYLRACKNNSSRVVGQLWSMSDLYSRRWPRYLSVACGKRPQRIRLLRTLPNMDRPECCGGEKRMELYPTTTALGMAILKWVAIQYLSVKWMRY